MKTLRDTVNVHGPAARGSRGARGGLVFWGERKERHERKEEEEGKRRGEEKGGTGKRKKTG